MSQSSIIFGALMVGFLIYITIRGRLAQYVGLFYTAGKPAAPVQSYAPNSPAQINPLANPDPINLSNLPLFTGQ